MVYASQKATKKIAEPLTNIFLGKLNKLKWYKLTFSGTANEIEHVIRNTSMNLMMTVCLYHDAKQRWCIGSEISEKNNRLLEKQVSKSVPEGPSLKFPALIDILNYVKSHGTLQMKQLLLKQITEKVNHELYKKYPRRGEEIEIIVLDLTKRLNTIIESVMEILRKYAHRMTDFSSSSGGASSSETSELTEEEDDENGPFSKYHRRKIRAVVTSVLQNQIDFMKVAEYNEYISDDGYNLFVDNALQDTQKSVSAIMNILKEDFDMRRDLSTLWKKVGAEIQICIIRRYAEDSIITFLADVTQAIDHSHLSIDETLMNTVNNWVDFMMQDIAPPARRKRNINVYKEIAANFFRPHFYNTLADQLEDDFLTEKQKQKVDVCPNALHDEVENFMFIFYKWLTQQRDQFEFETDVANKTLLKLQKELKTLLTLKIDISATQSDESHFTDEEDEEVPAGESLDQLCERVLHIVFERILEDFKHLEIDCSDKIRNIKELIIEKIENIGVAIDLKKRNIKWLAMDVYRDLHKKMDYNTVQMYIVTDNKFGTQYFVDIVAEHLMAPRKKWSFFRYLRNIARIRIRCTKACKFPCNFFRKRKN